MGVKGLRAYMADHKSLHIKNACSYRRSWSEPASEKKLALVFDNAALDMLLEKEHYPLDCTRGGMLTQVSTPYSLKANLRR
jgi:hypothetical protein